ncbi:MAG: DUF4129 domain-containing protein [Mycobacteriales bacterium]
MSIDRGTATSRRPPTMPPPPPSGPRASLSVVVAVLGALAGLVIVLLVARSGPTNDLHSHNRSFTPKEVTNNPQKQPTGSPSASSHKPASGGSAGWIGQVLLILAIIAGAVLAVVIGYYLYKAVTSVDWSQLRRKKDDTDAVEAPEDLTSALGEATRAGLSYDIEQGEPRNAIVACWRRLEDVAAEAGAERGASETSMEFTVRLLHRYDVDPASAGRLGELYREARFSDHEMPEDARAAARRALNEIGRQLSVRQDAEAAELLP